MPAAIPSPEVGVWFIGPIPIRAYALLIVLGIVIAVWLGNKRYLARGGNPGVITEIAIWAVPFGIIGGRQAVGWVRHFESGTAGLGSGVPSLSAPSARGSVRVARAWRCPRWPMQLLPVSPWRR